VRQFGSAADVGGLFFPRSAELGLAVEDTVSPRVLRKITYAGNRAASFAEASDALFELAEVSISAERVRRACGHVGEDLIDEQQQLQTAYQAKPLPEQIAGKPGDVTAPEIACVMADGGRYQRLDRPHGEKKCDEKKCDETNRGASPCRSARKGKHWKESRIALLATMSGAQHEIDPQPELPQALRYAAAAEKLGEIGKTGRKLGDSADDCEEDECLVGAEPVANNEPATREQGRFTRESAPLEQRPDSSTPLGELSVARAIAAREMAATEVDTHGVVGPKLKERSVVASRSNWCEFGPLVASQAWYRGFAAATRKVFVSDGSATIEKLQRQHFSHFTSVLDLLHTLAYALAAARAVSRDEAAAEQQYDAWARLIWSGQVAEVIDELVGHGEQLGLPPPGDHENDPREVIRRSRVFFENHRSRMDYPSYRRQGFPLTSSLMESTVKQVSRRVKGSEKFWSSPGAEAMLRLRAASLSEDKPLHRYFDRRSCHARGTRAYRPKPLAMNN